MSYQALRGRLLLCVMVCLSIAGVTTPALGGVINFSVTYSDPLFGTPDISGDSLLFPCFDASTSPPTPFEAKATSSESIVSIDGRLEVVITASQGGVIPAIHLYEWGAYTLKGIGSAAAEVAVSTPVGVTILEVDGDALATALHFVQMVPFDRPYSALPPNPSGVYLLPQDAGVGVVWEGDLTVSLGDKVEGNVTKAKLTVDNVLYAQRDANSVARIDKKGLQIDILVPEPSTLLLLICGCCAVLGLRRR